MVRHSAEVCGESSKMVTGPRDETELVRYRSCEAATEGTGETTLRGSIFEISSVSKRCEDGEQASLRLLVLRLRHPVFRGPPILSRIKCREKLVSLERLDKPSSAVSITSKPGGEIALVCETSKLVHLDC